MFTVRSNVFMDQNASSSSGGRLFFATVPGPNVAARIYRLAHALRRAHKFDHAIIEPECLHVSLFFLGELSDQLVQMACGAAAEVRMPPFEIWFDRSVSFRGRPGNRPFVLIGDDGVDCLRSFRRVLGVALAGKGLKRLAKRGFTPHVTLMYAEREVEEHPIQPIGWTVNEFVLIHSMRGHVHLARWQLRSCGSGSFSLI
jgi:2'-5' RNA ligase